MKKIYSLLLIFLSLLFSPHIQAQQQKSLPVSDDERLSSIVMMSNEVVLSDRITAELDRITATHIQGDDKRWVSRRKHIMQVLNNPVVSAEDKDFFCRKMLVHKAELPLQPIMLYIQNGLLNKD